jgi:hypothetical protein
MALLEVIRAACHAARRLQFLTTMNLNAGLDPILALLVGVGWFIVKAIMKRREDTDSWVESEQPAPPPHVPERNQGVPPRRIEKPGPQALPPPIRPTINPYYGTQKPKPPVASAPVIPPAPVRPMIVTAAAAEKAGRVELGKLKDSNQSYARASRLQQAVATRLTGIDRQTKVHKPTAPKQHAQSVAATHILRTFRNVTTTRQAFLASFVLNPPKALE